MPANRIKTFRDKTTTGSLAVGVLATWVCVVMSSWSMAQEVSQAKEPLGASQGFSKRTLGSGPSRVKVHFDVSYCEQNDPLQVADVYMPPSGDIEHQARYPAILAIHGGAWVAGDKRFDALHCRKMAEQGYVVMAINYRLAPKHKHPAQIDDCREALRWLKNHADEYHIDPERLGVWGYSAGGHLAALLSTDRKTQDPAIKVCVAGGAPVDLRMIPEDSRALAGFLGGTRRSMGEVYLKASPIEHVSSDDPPIMLYHGDADELVPIAFADKMHKKLQETGVETEYFVLPGRSHIMAFVDAKGITRSIEFLDRYLKN